MPYIYICHISMELMLKISMKRLHFTGGFAAQRMQWDNGTDRRTHHLIILLFEQMFQLSLHLLSDLRMGETMGNRTHAGHQRSSSFCWETNGFWMFLASQDPKKSRTSIKSSCFRNLETRNHLQLSSVVYSNMQEHARIL